MFTHLLTSRRIGAKKSLSFLGLSSSQSICCYSSSRRLKKHQLFQITPEIQNAVKENAPVVALESTIIAHGMPYPQNLQMAKEVETIVREAGAIPATIAVMNGKIQVGLTEEQLEALATAGSQARKCSTRDLAVACAAGALGATTVAATLVAARAAGARVFVTGGLGGVHRGGELSLDVSADLRELGRTPVAVVSAGAKSVLDIGRTLEYLETEGVPVVGFGTDEFPAFFSPRSGRRAPARLDSAAEVAAALRASDLLGLQQGMVIAVPNPEPMEGEKIEAAIQEALRDADARGVTGRDLTPFVLAEVTRRTGGASLRSNLALVRHNAGVGASIAVELSKLLKQEAAAAACSVGAPASADRPWPAAAVSSFDLRRALSKAGTAPGAAAAASARGSSPAAAAAGAAAAGAAAAAAAAEGAAAAGAAAAGAAAGAAAAGGGGGGGGGVAVVGGCAVDAVGRPFRGAPGAGTSSPGRVFRSDGGVGRNVAAAAAALAGGRVEVCLISAVGEDPAGAALLAGLRAAGVGAEGVAVRPGRRTATYLALLDERGGLRAAVADMEVLDSLGPADVRAHAPALARAGAVVADGNLPVPCLRELLQVCEEHNKPLIFDPVSEAKAARSIAAGVLEQSTLLTPNIGELKAFFLELKKKNSAAILARSGGKLIFDNPSPDERRANHKMATSEVKAMLGEIVPFALPILDSQSQQHRKGSPSKYLLVTLGQDGAVLLSKDSATDDLFEALYFPAVTENHEVVDVNGAGDALTAALALGMATGERIDKSMQRGVYIASQVVKSEFRLPKNELLQENMSDEKLNAVVPIQSQLLYFDDNNH